MPSSIVHAYIGLDTVKKLNNEPKTIIEKHIDNYKVYCQNMDVLYFYHILLLFSNKVQDFGHRIHQENTNNFFKILINENKKNKNHELFTFIAGLITHYKADSTMHPYINYLSIGNNKTQKRNNHFEIETYLDNYFINKRMHVNPQKYNNTKFVFNYTKDNIIKDEITRVYNELYNYPNMGKKYYRALAEMKFVFNYFRYDPFGIKRILYKLIDLNPFKNIPRVEYLSYYFDLNKNDFILNTNHNQWYNPHNKELISTKSFNDLYNDVINSSSTIINELYEYIFNNKDIDIDKLIGNYSYATGLSLSPNKNK